MSISYLSENTRKIRRSLLLVSLIGYSISELGLMLTEVQLFSSRFEFQNYTATPKILTMVVVYFLVTFAVYALSEYSQGFLKAVEEYHERIIQGKSYTPWDTKHRISSLQDEITELSKPPRGKGGYSAPPKELPPELTKSITQKTAEIARLEQALSLIEEPPSRVPFYARLSWSGLRVFVEIGLPILISVAVIAHLAFFTEISNPSLKGEVVGLSLAQPDSINVVTETPAIADTVDTMSGN